jgi:UDP-N-acetylglucosamine:LPS N-acetylglucosamine transferase
MTTNPVNVRLHRHSHKRKTRVLAVSSAGGHWVQLRRIRPAWQDCDIAYATSNPLSFHEILQDRTLRDAPRFYVFPEATRWNKLRLARSLLKISAIIVRERPDVVISTGAAPGYFAIRLTKLFGGRTVWIDSIANAAELSLAGRKAQRYADLWLTQWPHLAQGANTDPRVPEYKGAVI